MKKKVLAFLLATIMVISLLPTTAAATDYADTVVYGTIYTAEADNPTAEAIAVKDGKFVYVGDEAGVTAYIKDGVTQIIDQRGKGMVMPGCTDGHSHYTMKFSMDNMKGSIMFDLEDNKEAVLQKLNEASLAAKNAGKQSLFGFGWNYLAFTADPLTLKELDEATHGVSALIFDQGGHHSFCNSVCLERCGIIDGAGNVLITEIDGGYLELDDQGYPTGYADERVTGYFMRKGGIIYDEIFNDETAKVAIQKTQEFLLSTGYTMTLDGWSNMFHPSKLYKAASDLDKNEELKIVFPMTYEIEPWQTDAEIEDEIDTLASLNETYGTDHVLPQYLKLFMDGVVETKTGAMIEPFKDDQQCYKSFWSVDRLADITEKVNAKGLTMHIHTMGDAAVKEAADAYIQGGDGTHRNCLVHLRNVRASDFQRFAENNIACTAGITWHVDSGDELNTFLEQFLTNDYIKHAYPIKSFFDVGVKVSSHSDFPANIPCPQDPFGIMEVAVTGTIKNPSTGEMFPVYDEDELVTIEQAFQALTINGAWQLGLENERGSIKVGKWADFVLADQDVFTCPKTDIGKTKTVSTWFEGEKVYQTPDSTWHDLQDAIAFTDVQSTDYYYNAIKWAKDNGVTEGTSATTFSPNDTVTRAQVVTFLWRAAGCLTVDYAMKLDDVASGEYYSEAVRWALAEGITKGTDATHFDPDAVCTRGQIVAFLARFAGVKDTNTESVFSDVNASDYFAAAVKWAKDNKVTEGTSATTFGPNEDCTRGQVVTFLYRWMVK